MSKRNLLYIPLISFLAITGCTKNRTPAGIDAELFTQAQKEDLECFNCEYQESTKNTGHKSTYFRRKYNALAKTVVDSSESINLKYDFPKGSMIVYEMNSINKGKGEKYAIMFKDQTSEYKDKNGWVWSYVNSDNTIIEPASRKGVSCISCHSN